MNKILIISTSLNMGGAERQSVWLANKLSEKYVVYFFSLKSSGVLQQKLNKEVYFKNFKLNRSSNIFSKIFYVCFGSYRLVNLIKEEDISTVFTFLYHSNLLGKIIKFLSKKRIRHIICVRNDRLSKRNSRKNKIRTLIFKKFIIDTNSKIVFNSKAGLKNFNLKKKYNQRIIFNSPNNNPVYVKNKNNKFIYLGRLDELKNTPELLKAVHHQHKKGNKIFLDLYGKGPDYRVLNDFINENNLSEFVKLRGLNPDIPDALSEYSCLILPSTHEGFPNVLIESMKSKTFCISTNVGDSVEILQPNKGIIIDGYSYKDISLGIDKYLSLSNKEIELYLENAYEYVSKNLNEKVIYNDWISLINE